ncbi:MAG: preprotein translocase subunit SecA, partial [Candidatus Sericytochromatia bacterium]
MEAKIIETAGRKGAVTVATNMAGRGADIVIGGGKRGDYAWKEVADLGGLHVIGTERHESRRIDNQLRGRAGRQGDAGSSRFFLSLEDELMRLFGGDRITKIMNFLKVEDDMAIEAPSVSKAIENAQKKVELHHFGIRKSVLEYDEVLNTQRNIIYGQRRKILEGDNLKPVAIEMIQTCVTEIVSNYANPNIPEEEWDLKGIIEELAESVPILIMLKPDELEGKERDTLIAYLQEQAINAYDAKESSIGAEVLRDVERMVILKIIDQKWIDHLHEMDALRDGIGLRAYGQKDPLIEYKKEGRGLFEDMMKHIRHEAVMTLFHIQVEYSMP